MVVVALRCSIPSLPIKTSSNYKTNFPSSHVLYVNTAHENVGQQQQQYE